MDGWQTENQQLGFNEIQERSWREIGKFRTVAFKTVMTLNMYKVQVDGRQRRLAVEQANGQQKNEPTQEEETVVLGDGGGAGPLAPLFTKVSTVYKFCAYSAGHRMTAMLVEKI